MSENGRYADVDSYRAKVDDLVSRCAIKDNHLLVLMEKVAKLEENSENLEARVIPTLEKKIVELQAWKNKALGYLGALGVFSAYIIELLRETFIPK